MESRQLGRSGLMVPELCFGAGTIGTSGEFFEAWSKSSAFETDRIIGICMDAGLNFFDTADVYSQGGISETALGKALTQYKREDVLISTKATFRFGEGPNNVGSSRYHLIQSAREQPEASGHRLRGRLSPPRLRRDRPRRRNAAGASITWCLRARCGTSRVRTSPAGT